MDSSNIIDILTGLVALGALAVAIVYGQINARAADRAIRIAGESATSSAEVSKAERERDHDAKRPDLTVHGKFRGVHNARTKGTDLQFVFTLPRTYRMHGDAINENGSRTPLSIDPSNTADAGHERHINLGDADRSLPDRLELRFWPPEQGDSGEPWGCPCERVNRAEDQDSPGHWMVMVPVQLPPRPMFAYGA